MMQQFHSRVCVRVCVCVCVCVCIYIYIYELKAESQRGIYTPKFTAALWTTAMKQLEATQCPSTDDWISKYGTYKQWIIYSAFRVRLQHGWTLKTLHTPNKPVTKNQLLYDSTYKRYLNGNVYKQRMVCQRLGELVSCCVIGIRSQFCQMKNSGDWLDNNMYTLNETEQYM